MLRSFWSSRPFSPAWAESARRAPSLSSLCLGVCLLALSVVATAQSGSSAPSEQNDAMKALLASPLGTSAHPAPGPADRVSAPAAPAASPGKPHTKSKPSKPAHSVQKSPQTGTPSAPASAWRADWRRKWQQQWQQKQAKAARVAAQKRAEAQARKKIEIAAHKAHSAAPPVAAVKAAKPVKPADSLTSQTRPDTFSAPASPASHTQDSPMAAAGDAWKMLLYLVPMLLLTLGALRLLRRFYERTGRLPGPLQSAAFPAGGGRGSLVPRPPGGGLMNAMVGGFHLNTMRQRGGSSIRLIESVPVGGANLHLIEVRGRLLLVGATSAGVSLLTEFHEPEGVEPGDFRVLLQAAAADMDSLDLEEPDLPTAAMVGTLEDSMRETRDAVARRARRLRTVQEEEDACG